MPRTRPELNRDEKAAAILGAAEARLLEGGFDALTMAGVARDLGLAQNAIYWYFPSRADLFAAVLRRLLAGIAARKPRGTTDIARRVLWFTDQFAPLYQLQPAMHEQARESPAVADFVRDLEDLFARMLSNLFRGRLPDDELASAIDSFRTTVTGAYARDLPPRRRRELLTYSLGRLLDGG
jgi:AcrR family transcriptional regulator